MKNKDNVYTTDDFDNGMDNIRQKIKNLTKQGKCVVYSAIFITGANKSKILDHVECEHLPLVRRNLKYEDPDKVRIELFDEKKPKNNLWVAEIRLKPQAPEPEKQAPFLGLGEIEINQLVDERFQQRQRAADYEALQHKVSELSDENQELLGELDELKSQKEQLEKDLETKKNIRYYAGMLGDILESFGIAKDTLRKPLAGLMGIESETDSSRQVTPPVDRSGMVENTSPEEEKRDEVIHLISDYLHESTSQTLIKVFTIFSEIEKDERVADRILAFLNPSKPSKHANV